MKKIICILVLLMLLVGCGGESKPACEHANTTTTYAEGSWLSIEKVVNCDDCGKEIEKGNYSEIEYVYGKEIINSNGISVVVDKLVIDGWSSMELKFVIEGTSDKKRTLSVDKMFIDGTDASAWIYATDLSGNRKSNETVYLYDLLETKDFFMNQDHEIEIDYEISDSNSYKDLKADTAKFNLNEFTSINEVEE